jgi:penicillin-binding protein 1A
MSHTARQRRRRTNSRSGRRFALTSLVVVLATVTIGALAAVGWVVSVADSAPPLRSLAPRYQGQISEVYGSNGQLLGYLHSDVLRQIVPQSQLPERLKQATVAIEDRRFYQHGAIDYVGIVRAALRDLLHPSQGIQGASTLTMQLVDNLYLPRNIKAHHNLRYKIIQMRLAQELYARHSRGWILSQYLNDVDYGTVGGESAIGVGAASQVFFDKPVQRLDLAQYALLAGLPQAPSEYNPFNAPRLARSRRNQVLQAMLRSHYITATQAAAAEASPLQVKFNTTYEQITEPYVFEYVRQELIQRLGERMVDNGGLKVYTTIDPAREQAALISVLSHEGGPGQPAAALVSIDPSNGAITAMATTSKYGVGPGETTFDYATQAERQTGSAFKVFALMTLIHDYDGDPNLTYYDSHHLAPGWLPSSPTYTVSTAEDTYQGVINITKATWLSDNTVFAQLAQDLGMAKVSQTAHEMGITSPLSNYPSEVLGAVAVSPLQMADAYATLASGGVHHPPTAISRVVFPSGKVMNFDAQPGTRVFPYNQVYAADQVLEKVLTVPGATGTAAYYGCPAAGKTGTTNNYTDAYFDGYTPQLATAVWVGYPNETESMANGFGGTLAAPIWHDYMKAASDGYCGDFPTPSVPWQGHAFTGHYSATGHYSTATTTLPATTAPSGAPSSTVTTGGGAPLPGTSTTQRGGTGGGPGGVTTGKGNTGGNGNPNPGGGAGGTVGGAPPGGGNGGAGGRPGGGGRGH